LFPVGGMKFRKILDFEFAKRREFSYDSQRLRDKVIREYFDY
jgi:hypothetical protein